MVLNEKFSNKNQSLSWFLNNVLDDLDLMSSKNDVLIEPKYFLDTQENIMYTKDEFASKYPEMHDRKIVKDLLHILHDCYESDYNNHDYVLNIINNLLVHKISNFDNLLIIFNTIDDACKRRFLSFYICDKIECPLLACYLANANHIVYDLNSILNVLTTYKLSKNNTELLVRSVILHEYVHYVQYTNEKIDKYNSKQRESDIPYGLLNVETEAYAIQLLYLLKSGIYDINNSNLFPVNDTDKPRLSTLNNVNLTKIKNSRKLMLSVVDLFGIEDTRKIMATLNRCQLEIYDKLKPKIKEILSKLPVETIENFKYRLKKANNIEMAIEATNSILSTNIVGLTLYLRFLMIFKNKKQRVNMIKYLFHI